MVKKNKRVVSVFTLAVMILLATAAISGRCYAANRAEEILKLIVTVKDMPAGFTLERTNQFTQVSGRYENASKGFKGKHPFRVKVEIEQNLEFPSIVYIYDDVVKSILRDDSQDIIAENLGFGERSVHYAWRWVKSDPFYTSQNVKVYWRNWMLNVRISHYARPEVKAFTDESAKNWVRALAAKVFARFLDEMSEREVRFVDEENMWSPDDPLTLKVAIEEKIDGEWQARTSKSRARLAARPVYLVVTMRNMKPKSQLDRIWRDRLLGENGFLIAAYSDDSGNAITHDRLRFDRAYGFNSRYEVRGWEGGLSIDLRDGEWLPAKISGGGWLPDSEGRGDSETIARFRLAYDRTVELLEKVQTRRPGSAGMEFPPEWRRLRASVQVEAFEYTKVGGGNGTARREWRRLATSKLIPIYIDHIARLVWAGASVDGSSGITVHRAGYVKFTVPSEEMGRKLPDSAEYKLLAGDKVTLGSQDRVQINWVLRARDKWWIRANTDALATAGRKDVSFAIGGKGGAPLIRAASVGVFIADWGLSILISCVGPGPVSNYVIGWVAGQGTSRFDPGALTEWHLVTPKGTRLGFDLEQSGPRVYLFEGSVSVENQYGGVVRLNEGQMSTSLGQRGYSAPAELRTEDLSASLRASLEDAGRGDDHGTTGLPIPGARATGLRFYEAGYDTPPRDERRYAGRFPRSETRSVWFELYLEYPEPGRRIEFPVESVWYGPDGGVLGRKTFGGHVKADWDGSFHWDGWRPGDGGAWEPGEYRVEVFMGGQKVASGFYEIYEGETESTNIPIPDAQIVGVKFYRSGYGSTPFGQRTYKERFSKSESRYINWELKLIFPPPGRRIDFDIDAVWYRPDGSVIARQTKKAHVESAWKNSFHNFGWGWKSPGNWQPGKYRVELFIDGQKIAEGFFEIDNL